MSALLFHGPGARTDAVEYAEQHGRLLSSPFGEEGLSAEEAREVVVLLNGRVMGHQIGMVIVGPADRMKSDAAADILLKTLEDYDTEAVRPILWAHDAVEVRNTIRSRCVERWSPWGEEPLADMKEAAEITIRAVFKREWGTVIEQVKAAEKRERDLLAACTGMLEVLARSGKGSSGWLPLWLSMRRVLRYSNPSKTEVLVALLGRA